jgi:hypothetical protein
LVRNSRSSDDIIATGAGASGAAIGASDGAGMGAGIAAGIDGRPRFLVPESVGAISAFSTLVSPQTGHSTMPRFACLS